MSRWLITTDWQASRNNLDKCMKAFGETMHLAKQWRVKGIIHDGDIKNDYDPVPVDVSNFAVYVTKRIVEKGYEFLINLGNHDRIGQYSDHRNWLPILSAAGAQAYDEPNVVEYESVVFAILPYIHDHRVLVRDAHSLWKRVAKIKKRKILLFHCDVKGFKYNEWTQSSSKVDRKDLMMHKYDWCFGGHLHKHQVIKNSMYVGSPFACDWGEANQKKGYVLYDDEKNTVRFIPSNIPLWYTQDYLEKHKIDKVQDGTKIKVVVDCAIGKNYHLALDEYKEAWQQKYPNAKLTVVPRFTGIEEKKVIVDPDKSDEHKISSYVKATLPSELKSEKDKIIKYLLSKLKDVSEHHVRSHGEITIENVEAKNVLSYRKISFGYRKRGVCLVRGVNLDWPSHSNGAGKSNFLSLLPVSWFGRTFKKEQKNDEWANERTKGKAYVRVNSTDERGRSISVYRGRRPGKLKLKIDDKDASFGLRNVGQRETQGYIESIVGFSGASLENSIYIDSSMPKAFLEGTQKERSELISRFQNIERFKVARDVVAKEYRKVQEEINDLDIKLSDTKEFLSEDNQAIAELKDHERKSASKEKKNLKEKKILLISAKKKLKKAEKLKKVFDRLQDEYCKLDKQEQKYKFKRHSYKEKLKSIRVKQTSLDFDSGTCPTCGQEVTKDHKHTLQQYLSNKDKKLLRKIERLEVLEEKCEHKRIKVADKKQKIYDIAREAEDACKYAKDALFAAAIELKSAIKIEKNYHQQVSDLKKKMFRRKKSIKHLKAAIKDHYADLTMLEYCENAFSREGIPQFLNSLACPMLNEAAQYYSKLFTDNEIQVRFELDEGEIVPQIVNVHGSKKLSGQSDGERAWAGIITSLALKELAPKTNILIMDEPGYGLDSESARALGNNLKKLQDRFETVLVTTHNPEIEAALEGDNTITIVKENGISRLESKK